MVYQSCLFDSYGYTKCVSFSIGDLPPPNVTSLTAVAASLSNLANCLEPALGDILCILFEKSRAIGCLLGTVLVGVATALAISGKCLGLERLGRPVGAGVAATAGLSDVGEITGQMMDVSNAEGSSPAVKSPGAGAVYGMVAAAVGAEEKGGEMSCQKTRTRRASGFMAPAPMSRCSAVCLRSVRKNS